MPAPMITLPALHDIVERLRPHIPERPGRRYDWQNNEPLDVFGRALGVADPLAKARALIESIDASVRFGLAPHSVGPVEEIRAELVELVDKLTAATS